MGFIDRLRMNNLYPNIGLQPPDMNEGLDINKIIQQLIQPPPNPTQIASPMPRQGLPYAEQFAIMQRYKDFYKPMDTALGPGALNPAQIGLAPDKGDIFANNPKYALQQQQLAQKDEIARDRLALDRDKLTANTNLNQQRVDVSKQRAAIYDFKTKNPGLQFKVSQGGNFIAFNPLTGENFDTGVSTGTMSEEDVLNITGQQRLDQIRETGMNQFSTQGLRGKQALEQIGANIAGRKEIANMAPTRAELPTQTRVRQANAARELFNTDPELAKFVDVKPDGSFEITPPSTSFWGSPKGPTADQFTKIKNAIYGTGSASRTITNQPATQSTTPTPKNPPTAPKGWKYVPKSGGGWTAVEDKK